MGAWLQKLLVNVLLTLHLWNAWGVRTTCPHKPSLAAGVQEPRQL